MGESLFQNSPAARSAFERTAACLGDDFLKVMFEGPAERLTQTEVTQPAIVACSVAAYDAYRSDGAGVPDMMCGHSVGELSALVAAGCCSLEEALRLASSRGQAMQAAAPEGFGAMAAVVGAELPLLEEVLASHGSDAVDLAAINAPGIFTLSGKAEPVADVMAELKIRGVRRVVPLKVSAPFHSRFMAPAVDALRKALDGVTWRAPQVRIASTVTGTWIEDPQAIPALLCRQLTEPVRYLEAMQCIHTAGAQHVVEFGAGSTLSGLNKKIDRDWTTRTIGQASELENSDA